MGKQGDPEVEVNRQGVFNIQGHDQAVRGPTDDERDDHCEERAARLDGLLQLLLAALGRRYHTLGDDLSLGVADVKEYSAVCNGHETESGCDEADGYKQSVAERGHARPVAFKLLRVKLVRSPT